MHTEVLLQKISNVIFSRNYQRFREGEMVPEARRGERASGGERKIADHTALTECDSRVTLGLRLGRQLMRERERQHAVM